MFNLDLSARLRVRSLECTKAVLGAVLALGLLAAVLPAHVAAAATFTSAAAATPNPVTSGSKVTITAIFTSSEAINDVVLDLEVRDSVGKVFQELSWAQSFQAGETRTFAPTWTTPSGYPEALGGYSVKLGVFASDFRTAYHWNDNAGRVVVTGGVGGTDPGVVSGAAYYVDCNGGNDGNSGTDTGHAWSSVGRANQARLQPGDGLFFKQGCSWNGPLTASWNGNAGRPIKIGAYGSGSLPRIQNANPYQVRVTGSYLTFDHLWVRSDPDRYDAACNNNPIGYREGFYLDTSAAYNVVQNSLITDLGGGLEIATGSHHNSIHDNEFSHNNMTYNADQYSNDGGATALVMFGDNNDIGHNSIHDQVACSVRFAGGTIGHAFDVQWGHDNVYHHNMAWANGANFAELGGYDKSKQATNTVFAYNISKGSGFTTHDNGKGTKLYNNVFYIPGSGIISCGACSAASMTLRNNIFYGSTGIYGDGPLDEHHNIYWNSGNSVYNTQPLSLLSKIIDPLFANPGAGDFHLQAASPAINAGSMDSVNAGFTIDFDGRSVPQSGAVDIGAFELR